MSRPLNMHGFTLIELMLAMSIFSVVFIITTAGFIGINRTYTRGALRKQLSETVQALTDNVTSAVRVPQAAQPTKCTSGSSGCAPGAGYHVYCLTGLRYIWPDPLGSNGGLYRDDNVCTAAIDISKADEVVDSRFAVEDLAISAVNGTSALYRVKGVLRTTDINAFTTSDDNATVDRSDSGYSPYNLRCKGSAAGSVVQTCAIEQFDTVVSSGEYNG